MMEINFGQDDELNNCQLKFNQLCDTNYPEILEYDHYELYLRTKIAPTIWKRFLLNEQVTAWYQEEQMLTLRKKATQMIKLVGDTNSTAQVQGLTAILQQINKTGTIKEKSDIIIYNFIPLTKDEEMNKNVNKLSSIPNQIRNALQNIQRTTTNNKK